MVLFINVSGYRVGAMIVNDFGRQTATVGDGWADDTIGNSILSDPKMRSKATTRQHPRGKKWRQEKKSNKIHHNTIKGSIEMDRATRLVRRIPPLPANGIDSAEEKEEGHVEGTCNEFPWL